jgi:hypothetical protein
VGHTRKSTTGATTTDNAHSFNIGKILAGSHNGIILNHYDLNHKYNRDCAVDSMHLFHHLSEGLPFDDIHGYGAIEWVEAENPNRVYLCKLSGGELSIYGLKGRKGIIWSSDSDHVDAACEVARLKVFPYKVDTGQVYFVEGGKLWVDKGNTLNLASQTSRGYMPDWREGYYDWQQYQSQVSSVDVSSRQETIEDMINEMSEDEEREFRQLWELSDSPQFDHGSTPRPLLPAGDAEKEVFGMVDSDTEAEYDRVNHCWVDLRKGKAEWPGNDGVTTIKSPTDV